MSTFPDGKTPLNEANMINAMNQIMNGAIDDDALAAFLLSLNERGETVQEITGAARVMRARCEPINAPDDAVDCCGTGGDKSGTYNISTAVAIVAASCGVPIAKHGNRAASSKSGAADVLEALGVNLNAQKEQLEAALKAHNFAFLMAPNHHKAMKHVAAVRKKLARRTIFNLLGPLANPAGTKRQLIGVFDRDKVLTIAQVLKNLGTQSAWVVHGDDGLDEITVAGNTHIAILKDGEITERTLNPQHFGLPIHAAQDLLGGDAQTNANALMGILNGERTAYRDIVLANTAAVLSIHSGNDNLKATAIQAADAIDDGRALQTLNAYIKASNEG